MNRHDVVIIGSGVAGASTAYFLQKKHGMKDILILEKESTPSSRASGLNAGMVRQAVETYPMTMLAKSSAEFFSNPPEGFCEVPFFSRTGGIITTRDEDDKRLGELAATSRRASLGCSPVSRKEVLDLVPLLDEAPFVSALHCPRDGILDIHSLVSSFLKGTAVLTSTPATGFRFGDGRVSAVITPRGEFECDVLVIAAGAFSERLANMLGLNHVVLEARRRHLAISSAVEGIGPSTPYYWSLDPQVYFRYESGGLLLSPCDETGIVPETLRPTAEMLAWLYERLKIAAPKLVDIQIRRYWAELRTFTFDNNFLIGFDPKIRNLFWNTALQGHGMTCSASVGEMAADLIAGKTPGSDYLPHSPSRFA